MHLTRAKVSRYLPIPRKGTKYVARASSHVSDGIPVVVAIRDVLKLAKTAKEVNEMIKNKAIKINGRIVKELRESIRLFNILEADKTYKLMILPTGRFNFEETKDDSRLCKVVNRTAVAKGMIQLNLHDGSNILSKDKIAVKDSVKIDFDNKIKTIIKFEKGKKAIVISGRRVGLFGVVGDVKGKRVDVKIEEGIVTLNSDHVVAYE